MVIISNVEMQVAIVAANMPSLKAFYTCWQQNKLGPGKGTGLAHSSGGGAGGTSGGKSSEGSQGNIQLRSGVSASAKSRSKSKAPDPMALTMTESEEKLFETQNQKQKNSDYESSMQSGRSG
ncbi:hypothetical protein B7463_g11754, partial [Scytalidium lignicola]